MSIQLSRANSGTPLTTADYNSDNLIVETAVNALQSAGSSGGTVTNFTKVDTDTSSELFSASVSNPTTTPEITFSRISKAANLVYASPDGASGKPTMRALVSGDLPVVPNSKGGTGITDVMPNNQVLSKRSGTVKYTGIIATGASRIVVTPTTDNFEIDIVPANIEINTLASATPLTIAKGGTNASDRQSAINSLTGTGTNGQVFTLVSGNGAWANATGIASVNGKSGASVILITADIAESGNLYYTDGRVDARIAVNSIVAANTAKVTNATHTGDVLGSTALTIAPNVVTYAKMQIVGANKILGNPTNSPFSASEITTCPNLVFIGSVLKQRESIFANKSSAYTMTNLDGTIYADATSAAFTVKLPDTTTLVGGEIFTVQRVNSSAKNVTITPLLTDGTEVILGATSETSMALAGIGHNIKVQYVGDISGIKTFRVISLIK